MINIITFNATTIFQCLECKVINEFKGGDITNKNYLAAKKEFEMKHAHGKEVELRGD